jgi:DNA-binding MarR family transcriptional regulator
MGIELREFSREDVVELIRMALSSLAEVRAGDTTVNELRVVNQLIICHLHGRSCTVTSLHHRTKIPMPTVSRIVAQLQSKGWIYDEQDPEDGRRHIIKLKPGALQTMTIDFDSLAGWLNGLVKSRSANAGESCDCSQARRGTAPVI